MSRINTSEKDGKYIIAVEGSLVFDLNREFRQAYRNIPPDRQVVVDLSRSDYLDSAGLGMLIQLREHLGGAEASVALRGVNETIRTILDVANFGRLFRIA